MSNRLHPDKIVRIQDMLRNGASLVQVARAVGCSPPTVARHRKNCLAHSRGRPADDMTPEQKKLLRHMENLFRKEFDLTARKTIEVGAAHNPPKSAGAYSMFEPGSRYNLSVNPPWRRV